MTPYGNASGNSGVLAYEVGADFIRVRFQHSPVVYRYDAERPGASMVAHMKALATRGSGLSTYISQQIGTNYSAIEQGGA